MNTKPLVFAGIALLSAGCALMETPRGGGRVSYDVACPPSCIVTVTVADGCIVQSANPPELYAAQGNPVIRWVLVGPIQYKFAQGNGIEFPASKNAGKTAPFSGSQGGGRQVTLNDRNQTAADAGRWQYNINVVDSNNRKCALDPTVINDDGSTTYY